MLPKWLWAIVNVVSPTLVIVGALNWGLVGAFGFNLVEFLLRFQFLIRTVYVLIGLAALPSVWVWLKGLLK